MVIDTSPVQHDPPRHDGSARASAANKDRRTSALPWLWLVLGALLQMLSVGGRWDIALAAWVAPILLLRFVRASRKVIGLPLVVAVCAGGGAYWFYQEAVPSTWTTFGGLAGMGAMLAIPYLLDRFANARLSGPARILLFPVALTTVEYLLGAWGPFGTAYGLLGVTQHADLGLLQVTSVTGPYSIAFLIGLVATGVNHTWESGPSRRGFMPAVAALVLVALVITFGQTRMALAAAATSPTVRVAGINPDLASMTKASEAIGMSIGDLEGLATSDKRSQIQSGLDIVNHELLSQTAASAEAGAKIVVWSENAAHVLAENESTLLSQARQVARQHRIYLDAAISVVLDKAPYGRDETVMIGPDGRVLWTYQKHHPIPGLEPYTPGRGVVPVIDTPYGRIANVICYDADFPSLMHIDADIVLVPGGDWPAMGRLHTQMASLRAIENGYALVREDFFGSSQAFDRQGNVLSQRDTTVPETTAWTADVPVDGHRTFYSRVGDVFAWLCALGTLALLGLAMARRRSAESSSATATNKLVKEN